MAYRNKHSNPRPVVLASVCGLEEPEEEIGEGSAGRCRGAEYCEELFAICPVCPTRQQRGREGECSRRCMPFRLDMPAIGQKRIDVIPLWMIRAAKMTDDSSCEPAPEAIDDPRASPSDNACKTNPKVRAKPFPGVEILNPSGVAVRGVVGRWALVEADLCMVVRGDRPGPSPGSPNSTSASNSTVESFGESKPEPGENGPG